MLEDLSHPADECFLVYGVQPLQGGSVALVLHNGQLLHQHYYSYFPIMMRQPTSQGEGTLFLDLLDPDQDPLVRGTDPDPEPSIIKQK
jgi:hypothetical protein